MSNDVDFRETLYTINKSGERKWVYPTVVNGFYRRYRRVISIALIVFYLLMPWITVNGKQAVLLNIFERKFTLFGATFWATDTYYLFLLLALLGLSLFFFTAIFGRVWCGWACPETVFLEFLFRPIEMLIEGSPNQRRKLDQASWNKSKIIRKSLKWFAFASIAWVLANTVLAYFFGRESLLLMISHAPWENPQPFFVQLFVMSVILFQFGWFREQFCTILCPYARFQSVLLDSGSLLVGYDSGRGEPRGKLRVADGDSPRGDCIDCGMCVKVCPTGIDIRNGLQLECIQCAACSDACDSVMEKIGRPLGLVRYDTESGLAGSPQSIFRPRVIIYGILLSLFGLVLGALLYTRTLSEFQILRASKSITFEIAPDGRVVNQFKIHVSNKSDSVVRYSVVPDDERTASQITIMVPSQPFPVQPESLGTLPLFVTFPETLLMNGKQGLVIRVSGDNSFVGKQTITLIGPG